YGSGQVHGYRPGQVAGSNVQPTQNTVTSGTQPAKQMPSQTQSDYSRPTPRSCGYCGAGVSSKDKFCMHCGNSV
ncbi:MAG: hypothetical protein OEY49_12330, partial [Candidatus Heimdallarchaeota archaeon]|nr:hypothetical protein [Candidatus Heimdallarchaeota archaeon]